ncbi:MAG: hypothetical protein AAGI72_14445 [Pseudomonadota bacterium]
MKLAVTLALVVLPPVCSANPACDPLINVDSVGFAWIDSGEPFTGILKCSKGAESGKSATFQYVNGFRHGPSTQVKIVGRQTLTRHGTWHNGELQSSCTEVVGHDPWAPSSNGCAKK